jgi:hypothetical protein
MSNILDFLEKENPHKLDTHITFDEGPHIYTIDGDSDFMSVTRWNHSHFPHFNANKIITRMMNSPYWEKNKYYGLTKEEIKKQWNDNGRKASADGTKMHYDIECFYNNIETTNESIEFKYFWEFYEDFNYLKPYRTEWMVWDKELKLAGSIDMLFENSDGTLEIYDWKRCKEIKKTNNWGNSFTKCISHLPDSNFWHYSLQLNTYKYLLEKNYGKKINGMYLICLHPNNKNKSYIRLEVPDLTNELNNLMKLRLSMVNKIKEENAEENPEEEIEVDELEYKNKIYLVDISTKDILSEEGEIIGKWINNIPHIFESNKII